MRRDDADEEVLGAGEKVILSMTVCRSLWNAAYQLVFSVHWSLKLTLHPISRD